MVVRSSAPACSGIGPQGDPGTPTRIARIFPSGYWWCSDGASSDGQGDVAFACQSALPENGWNELYSRDGTVNTQINSWVAARGLADGFITDYVPFGGFKEDLTFAWFDGAWHHYDTWIGTRNRADYLDSNLTEVTWYAYSEAATPFTDVHDQAVGLAGHDFSLGKYSGK